MAVADHDGAGPAPPMLYRAWSGGEQGPGVYGLNVLTARPWTLQLPFPDLGPSSISALLGLDVAAGGVPAGTLVISGSFSSADGSVNRLGAWDGQTLRAIGPSAYGDLVGHCTILRPWDPDGSGPSQILLIAAGSFSRIGGVTASSIAVWDGGSWAELAGGLPEVWDLAVHDFDGEGPEPPRLVAALESEGVRVCTMDAWVPLGAIRSTSIASHDPDGDGLLAPQLFAHTAASDSGPFVVWNGSGWDPAAEGWPPGITVSAKLRSFDLDGDGPAPPVLVAGGELYGNPYDGPFNTFCVLTDQGWRIPPSNPYDGTIYSPGGWRFGIHDMVLFDPDGLGPRGGEIAMAGGVNLLSAPLSGPCSLPCWNGEDVVPPDSGFWNLPVWSFLPFDIDGPGPGPARLFVTGEFRALSGHESAGIAVWENGGWSAQGEAADAIGSRWLTSFDPDGDGPQAPWLLGARRSGAGPIVNRWTGQRWEGIGDLVPAGSWFNEVVRLQGFDEDGPGPLPPTLFAAGNMRPSALMRLNGEHWEAAGSPRTNWTYTWIQVHDPDGPGSEPESLLAFGLYGEILRWTGGDWASSLPAISVANSMGSTTYRWNALSWDTDGQGPRPTELIVCANQITTPDGVFRGAAAYDGSTWRGLASGTPPGAIRAAWVIDIDGPGPLPEGIIVCGTSGVARLHNGAWVTIPLVGAGLAAFTPGVEGPGPGELFIAGDFTTAGGEPAPGFARWRLSDPVQLLQNPEAQFAPRDGSASLTVAAAGTEPRFQWRRNGAPISNGPGGASPGGGLVRGADIATLTIDGLACSDAGAFDCVISNGCGSVTSAAAALVVLSCPCDPDVNCDGDLNGFDVQAMELAVNGDTTSFCQPSTDFNLDGAINGFDVEAVEQSVNGGPCP